jgi:GTP cyclohydrolase I
MKIHTDDVAKIKPSREEALRAVRTVIAFLGDDPDREGLIKTPERVLNAWESDWGVGLSSVYVKEQEESIRNGVFDDGGEHYDAMIMLRRIHFVSHCEHHMAMFTGTADVAYIPSPQGKIIGLSKIARVVELFSRRLQVQERLTTQIADFIMDECNAVGVGVVVRAIHTCMLTRGIRQPEVETITSALRGELFSDPSARSEFFNLVTK